jgi:hypothetical protein
METNWQAVSSYDGISLTHTLSTDTDSLIANAKYRFRIRAENAYGSSEWSATTDVAVAPLPSSPLAPTKIQELSSKSSIAVEWTSNSGDTEPVLGFRLFLQKDLSSESELIYDGAKNPNKMNYLVEGLAEG